MDTLQNLINGFGTALSLENLIFATLGCLVGTLIGVLPGIGPVAGTAILIPLTFHLPPAGAIIMLAAIYYGSMYGGTITSVLLNVPGEAASAITCLDGYEMAKRGRAGVALSIAAIGSFLGGTVAVFGLVVAAPPLARVALQFGPPEQFALMLVALTLLTALSGRSMLKGLIMGVFGLLLAMIGMDPALGAPRFTFGSQELLSGLDIVPVFMGLFGLGEILVNAEKRMHDVVLSKMSSLIPTGGDLKASAAPILRGTGIGFFLGLIPGIGAVIPTFISYAAEKKLAKHPERFGSGAIEGVAGPETANNAYSVAALIPLFTLGIPGSATVAVLMGAFIINGLTPGPLLFRERPDVVWSVIASLYVGNVILLVLNLPLIGMWIKVLKIPYGILFVLILTFMLVGAYSTGNSAFGIWIMVVFGVLGYAFKKLDFPLAPIALTITLGPLMERALRQSLEMSQGDFTILLTQPISAALLGVAALFVVGFAVLSKPKFGGFRTEETEV